jgi:uncharacterized protein YukE
VARYSFPALGFDPAPGDPDAVDGVAQDCTRCGQELADDANRLGQVQHLETWRGQAAAAFASHPAQLRDDLLKASHAYGGAGSALTAYAIALRKAPFQARRTEDTAAEARLRIDRHGAEADRLTALIESAPPGMSTADQEFERDGFRRRQVSAQEESEAAVTLARRIAVALELDGDRAAARIRSLGDAPYHQPGVLSRLVGGAADWVSTHADGLRAVSNVLKGVSAVAGLLSFIPVLTPIFAPIAALTAVGALAIDGALVAAGHGDWKSLAVDAALMALPGAGRLASEAVLAGRGSRLVAQDAAALQTVSSKLRPATVATLLTRNPGTNLFRDASRGVEITHPRLLEALDKVPAEIRTDYHGRCAEMRAIDQALHEGARLKGAVITTAKVRPLRSIAHGTAHHPCASCAHILQQFGIKYRG